MFRRVLDVIMTVAFGYIKHRQMRSLF